MREKSPTKLPLLFLLLLSLLPLFSLSFFHPQDNYILTFNNPSSSSSKPNPTHSISPNSTPHTSTYPFSFSLPLSSTGPHILRLHFNPTTTTLPTPPLFNVSASDFPLLPLFSPSLPTTKEFFFFNLNLNIPSLLLSFTPSSTAFVNAIELFSVPKNLILGPAISLPDTTTNADLTGHVLELLHRVNVGGPLVTPKNDTLWRTWAPDRDFFIPAAPAGEVVEFSGRINYPDGGATPETAPETVYGTARQMGWTGNSTSDRFNLTWTLPVSSSDHGYLIRLHFCDIISKALYELYFDIYINDYLAYKDLDLSSQSLSLASPYYIDFVLYSNPSPNISISVGPSARSLPYKVNAILNGIEIMKINGIARFCQSRNKNHTGVLLGSILGSFVILCCFLSVLVILCRWRMKGKQKLVSSESMAWVPLTELTSTSSPASNLNPSLKIQFSEILLATKNFDEKSLLGSGGFGKVYKGVLRDGTVVAVKRGDGEISNCGSKQGFTEFQAEILVFSKIRHRHLVSLIGYCNERSEMILVYEFMENGPLKDHLYGSNKPHLSWKQRLEICIGSARGLHYLHTGTAQGVIIHRDVKSSNILLDESYTAKVADFGLSKSSDTHISQDHVSTGVKGSFGYLDPEYFRTQQLTDKSDVYSFGVVLLEVLCARSAVDRSLSWEKVNLAEWGANWLKKGQIEKIVDAKVKGEIDCKSLKKFTETVEKCLAQYGVDRPTMGDVLWNLESALQLHEAALLRRVPLEDCSNRPSEVPSSDGS